ncbi:MAG: YicC/YloC family endoribonuclease [Gemmatimonadota bacterium]
MTGFGAGSVSAGTVEASVEIRTVNARHLKLNLRLPTGFEAQEEALRTLVVGAVRRGTVDVTLRTDGAAAAASTLEIDERRLQAVLNAFREIGDRFGVPGEIDLALLARSDRLLVERVPRLDELIDADALREAAEAAIDQLLAMREAEGARIAEDFRSRLDAIGTHLGAAEAQAPRRLDKERERLREAIAELTTQTTLDDDRLAREIAILADRWDLGEEFVRARAHLQAFKDLLNAPDDEPVGKRLGFLAQELLREINTIGSKANDSTIQHAVVEMKNEVETLREQIENVE